MSRSVSRCAAVLVVALLLLSGAAVPVGATAVAGGGYQAVIRRTSFGVPHILAARLGDAGFGQGWAYAEDRFCDLADQVVKIRSQRSRWFGPGPGGANLGTDLGYLALGLLDRAREQADRFHGDARDLLDGYVAGYNAYLARTGAANVPGWCAGQPWLGPITVVDLLAYQRDIAISASGRHLLAPAALAQPPGSATRTAPLPVDPALVADGLRRLARQATGAAPTGSNGWGVGGDRSASGRGILVANPHFPWEGEQRFWESQLRVPGRLDVYGAGLGGVPGVQIGFNASVAWTHTVATGYRYTLYSVDLPPGDPTSYLVDGVAEPMTARQVSIDVDWGDGRPQPLHRTIWSTRYGPVLDLSAADPALGWSTSRAVTYRDANLGNDRLLEQWLEISRARDVAGVRRAISRHQGIPWVNTIAADHRGDTWYADASATPNLSAATTEQWRRDPFAPLDGSDSANTWVAEPGAREAGLIPFARQPRLARRDYVMNANDSYWLANEHRLLTGFSPLQGTEGTPRSPRTRQNIALLDGAGPPGRVDPTRLGAAILSDRGLLSDQLTAAAVTACRAWGSRPVDVDGVPVDITAGCAALAGWDRRFDVHSRGAVLWRETVRSVLASHPGALTGAGALFGVGFDPADPAHTPRAPAADPVPLLTGLGRALLRLRSLDLAPDVRLGDVQYAVRGDQRIAVPGASNELGIANVVGYTSSPGMSLEPVTEGGDPLPGTDLTDRGYVVNFGTSFLLVVGFTDRGPAARALLTFGQSADPASPHFADQTRLFGDARLREVRFTERAIAADPHLAVRVVRG
ncbi:penicillin acylase family protein [Plantactinospora sp. KLBMP9567]|uniref:penicillin acylase family protein n=1 Tax=Plantactinospora sp. KLBMP9567 TaxID=3085900 RepID=UPI0029820A20|nr:penicillin acylase family protein [Plantactinospora sp. KLBMP9567]MDW5324842.1 penicillin acylase family protein [Plantactinospora sp. KLBMP9567]